MNIFVSDVNPLIAARNLDDSRVRKMILESTQVLANCLPNNIFFDLVSDLSPTLMFTLVHRNYWNHPCSVWVRKSWGNYYWLLQHLMGLCKEYSVRFGKVHAWNPAIDVFGEFFSKYHKKEQKTPFCNCSFFKNETDIIKAYRMTLVAKWQMDKREPKWTNGQLPEWSM